MKMHILSGGRIKMMKRTFIPDAPRGELIDLPVSCILLRHPQGNVLFDTGCHPDVATDPEGRLGTLAKYMISNMHPGDHVVSSLKAIGLETGDIDVVVCSHLHTDHCGCNQFFKMATVMAHELEFKAAREPGARDLGYLDADWDHPQKIETITGHEDLFGDGKITLVPLPGHSQGLTGALVRLERDGSFLLPSDALSLRENLDRNTVPRNTWNAEAFLKSFNEIRKIEASGATIICSHDAQQWETLRKGADCYE